MMISDNYECPRCHNNFPSSNKILHDVRCTEEHPLSNNDKENFIVIKKENEENKKSDLNPFFVCDICHINMPQSEKNDHILCHNLDEREKKKEKKIKRIEEQKRIEEEIRKANEQKRKEKEIKKKKFIEQQKEIERQIKRNNQDLQASRRTIEEQKEIERQIKRENEMRQQNQRDRERNPNRNPIREQNRNQNNYRNNNMLSESDMEFFSSGLPMRPNTTQNNNRGHNQRVIIRSGPNGTIIQQFGGNSNDDEFDMMNNMMSPMMGGFFNSPFQNRGQRVNIPFEMFSNRNTINELIQQLMQGRNRDHPTAQHILNELPETQIDDVNKLDPEKRNCVICLEDFKDKEKTIALPCIHVFHSDCIKSWLGSHNCCPTCKFELTYQNINSHQM